MFEPDWKKKLPGNFFAFVPDYFWIHEFCLNFCLRRISIRNSAAILHNNFFVSVKIVVPISEFCHFLGPKPSSLVLGGMEFLRTSVEEPFKPLPDLAEKYGPIFLLRGGLFTPTSPVVIAEPKVRWLYNIILYIYNRF